MKTPLQFKNAQEMLDTIQRGTDLYNPECGIYVFVYNDEGSICYYSIDREQASELAAKVKVTDEYWGAFLGWGGHIIDVPDHECWEEGMAVPLDFCKEVYRGQWFDTRNWE